MATSNKRRASVAVALLISSIGILFAPSQAYATPDDSTAASSSLDEVQKQVVDMQHQLEVVTEQYNDAKILLDQQKVSTQKADAAYVDAQAKVDTVKKRITSLAVNAYKGTPLAGLTTLMSSASPQEVLDRLNTLDQISAHNNAEIAALVAVQQQASAAKGTADAAQSAAQKTTDDMATKKTDIESKLPVLKAKVASLTPPQQAAVVTASGGQQAAPADTPISTAEVVGAPSAAAAQAVQSALSRVGMPYVWAAAGPGSFDCSGLTMWSYAQAGIGLPHSSSAQRGAGPSVSLSALMPGDLVFMPGHVGMYIGGGQVVHAPTSGQNVKVVSLGSMSWSMANRPTG